MRHDSDDEEYDYGDDDEDPRFPAVLKRYLVRRLLILAWLIPAWTAVMMLPTLTWAVELTRHFTVYWLIAALAAAIVAACHHRWVRTAFSAAAVAVHGLALAPYYLPAPEPAGGTAADRPSFTLLTANLLLTVRDPEATLQSLQEANADVLLLQEFSPEWARHLQPLLAGYPVVHRRAQDDPFGILFASRLPVKVPEILSLGTPRIPAVVAELTVGSRKVRFAGIHLMNPVLPAGAAMVHDQVGQIPAMLSEGDRPDRILAGDFNATPYARTFRNLLASTGLRDSALGRGIRHTWSPVRWPVLGLPLDHVLISENIVVLDREEGPAAGSDHRWVKVRLAIAGP